MRIQLAGLLLCLAALRASAGESGGTLSGKVGATPAKHLAETIVYLEQVTGTFPKRTHQMDPQGMKFVPRLLAITQGDAVSFTNHDGVAHNVYSPDGDAYNLGAFKEGEERVQTFAATGIYTQLCSIHPEMLGYILVSQNPFAAVVDEQGRYQIKGIPPGTHQVKAWSARLPAATGSATIVAGGKATLDLQLHR
jgi:plastocyanin